MRILLLSTALMVLSACSSNPVAISNTNGDTSFSIDCLSVQQCITSAEKQCKQGYNKLDQVTTNTTLVPHYGEHPIQVMQHRLLFSCQ